MGDGVVSVIEVEARSRSRPARISPIRRIVASGGCIQTLWMVTQFRATHDVWAGDPAFTELLERLRQGSPEFVRWWKAHEVRSTASGRKSLHHPNRGLLQFEYTSFQANDDPALKLVIYTPV